MRTDAHTATTRPVESSAPAPILYLSFELGEKTWKLGFTTGLGQRPRLRTVEARDLDAVRLELERAKARFRLPANVQVRSCYEAGRDGFWLHRWLMAQGVASVVVDSSSIEVKRRRRRVKTDRLDCTKLLDMLVRHWAGEKRVWSVVRVPSPEAEDQRHLHRERDSLKRQRTRLVNRIKGLLSSVGVRLELAQGFLKRLEQARLWDGSAMRSGLQARLTREWARLARVEAEIGELENTQRRLLKNSDEPAVAQVRQLAGLRAIGPQSAWVFVMEFFGWRQFSNRGEVAALAGLTPTPYQSGDSSWEQGASKSGNRRIRHMAVEIAWSWVRYQGGSALTQWYWRRFGHGSNRLKKIGIVALARKLLIALWRYLETGALPDGAELKAA